MNQLFPHQFNGAVSLAEGMPTYLAFDMGIGKTRTFIEAVKLRKAKRVLVLCPAPRRPGLEAGDRPVASRRDASSSSRSPADLKQPATYLHRDPRPDVADVKAPVARGPVCQGPFRHDRDRRGPRLQRAPTPTASRRCAALASEAGPYRASQRHPDEEPRRGPLHPAGDLLAAGHPDDPCRIRGHVLPGRPQDLRRPPA